MSDDEPTFEQTDSGAADTYPLEAGQLKKGGHVMIKGFPCKITDLSSSKTGKHGHAKMHIVAEGIFDGKKREELQSASHTLPVPFVIREEYSLADIDMSDKHISLLSDSGDMKEDLFLPTAQEPKNPDADEKLEKELVEAFDAGKEVRIVIQKACGIEKALSMTAK